MVESDYAFYTYTSPPRDAKSPTRSDMRMLFRNDQNRISQGCTQSVTGVARTGADKHSPPLWARLLATLFHNVQ
jgi:hypothetical protein